MKTLSLRGKLILTILFSILSGAVAFFIGIRTQLTPSATAVTAICTSLITGLALSIAATRKLQHRIQALESGLLNLLDNDFSTSINTRGNDDFDTVLSHYNTLVSRLRKERQHLFQRELLLDTVIQNSELAVLLLDASNRVVYCNYEAGALFQSTTSLQGSLLSGLLETAHPSVREMFTQTHVGLFSIETESGGDVYHFSTGSFTLNTEEHRLYLIKKLTREINRKEIETWKKMIRVISHEINNSLAPIASMAHTGSELLAQQKTERLETIFSTISERSAHLIDFIEQYIRLARLPTPNIQHLQWQPLLQRLQQHYAFELVGAFPSERIRADATQLEQALLNLLKNAHESGSNASDIQLHITADNGVHITVRDRGKGFSPEALKNAQLPLYTTKPKGSGIGLALTREIAEAHGGTLTLGNRNEGGAWARLTLSH